MDPRSRGRATRGRARGAPQQAPTPAPGGPRPVPAQGPPPQGAWGARPGGPPQGPPAQVPAGAWGGRAQPQPPAQQQWAGAARPPAPEIATQQTVGRGSRQGGGDERGPEPRTGAVLQGGDASNSDRRGGGNGGVRGRTNRNEIINTRPHKQTKKGTEGTPIRLRANYFEVRSPKEKWGLNQYRVDFVPEIDNTSTRRYLVRTGLRNVQMAGYLFDGTQLYTPNKLQPEPYEMTVQNDAGENIMVTIRLVGEVKWGDYHYLQVFNIIMRKCLTFMNLKLMGRNYFDPQSKIALAEHNLELWPGYFMTMRQYETEIMLNVDLSFKVLRTDSVLNLLQDSMRDRDFKGAFTNAVIGNIVLTYYNQKTYRIDDVDWSQNPQSSFQKRDGTSITYAQYFTERYRVNIRDQNQPLLVSRTKPREIRAGMPEVVLLIPELCIMTGLSDRQRENFHLMKAMGEHTRVGPKGRMDKVRAFQRRLEACPEAMAEVRNWGLQFSNDIIELKGRVLPEETLYLKNNHPIMAGKEADWTRNLRVAPMYSLAPSDTFCVLCPPRCQSDADHFVKNCLIKAASGMQFSLGRCEYIAMPDDRLQTYLQAIDRSIQYQPKIILTILQNNSADRYNTIKKKCYVDIALPCQVMLGKNLCSKGAMSIATKVAIQMNCKLGGAPWGCSMPGKTMVVGYDVCRDTANRGKSFAGMVASTDANCSRYFSHTVEHEHEQELSNNIASFMILACQAYKKINNVIPERIVIYRDGVGDGQIPYVKEHEVELVKTKLKEELYGNQPIRMAFIVVSKRINTKIFRAEAAGRERPDFNPPPGTIVDDVITWPERYDFYLISQCVRQGTVAPTSYNVIEDTLGIDANKLQRFTYRMCHMYYNWSGTVRVPAPCQYAHKLAFLTAQSLHRTAHPRLQESLYFLARLDLRSSDQNI